MSLSGSQYEQFQKALIDAFPTKASLVRMLRHKLDKNLDEIAGGSNLQEIVFNLIQTAVAQEWVENLAQAACEQNPRNSQLKAIALELFSSDISFTSEPKTGSSTTVVKPKQEQEVEGSSYMTSKFDVFLAHNSQDKPQVREIANELKRRGLKPWLDDEQIPPGRPFQDEIQQAIPLVKSAAIFLGLQGLGRWQAWELKAFISECTENKIPVIPVLLPGVNDVPQHLRFLREFRWVDFSDKLDDEQALYLLQWGITGQKPDNMVDDKKKPGHIPEEQYSKKYEYEVLCNSLEELERAINTLFHSEELANIVYGLNYMSYETLNGETQQEKVKELIAQLQKNNQLESLIKGIENSKPEAFRDNTPFRFDIEILRNSPDELERAINTLFHSEELANIVYGLNYMSYETLNGETQQEKVKELIAQLQKNNQLESLIKGIRHSKPEAFRDNKP